MQASAGGYRIALSRFHTHDATLTWRRPVSGFLSEPCVIGLEVGHVDRGAGRGRDRHNPIMTCFAGRFNYLTGGILRILWCQPGQPISDATADERDP
jgi:hypothetical protein